MTETVVIGNATLHHGDCLELFSSVPVRSVKSVITDPPYSINTKSDGNGKLSPWADLCNAAFWYAEWFKQARSRLTEDGCMWSCLNWRSIVTFQKAAMAIGWPIESLLVWDKGGALGPGGPRGLRPSYELVALWAMPEFSIENRGIRDLQTFKWGAFKPNGHPAEKPVSLMRFLIDHSTDAGETILDPFMGSGTTGVAALAAGRRYVGFEQDAEWFERAADRISKSQEQQRLFA